MKVLVAVKRVVDYNVKIRVKGDGSAVETAGVKMSINPFDEIALEEALRLKEKGIVTEIIAVSIGDQKSQETLRSALALSADRAILVQSEQTYEPLNIAKILHAVVLQESVQLVLLGKQAIDDDCNQTGQMLAGLLQWPQGTFTSKLMIQDNSAEVTREVDGGLETLGLTLPAVVTTDLRLNVPRYISLPNIMKAKQKPLVTLPVADLGLTLKPHAEIIKIAEPPSRDSGVKVNDIVELMAILKDKTEDLP